MSLHTNKEVIWNWVLIVGLLLLLIMAFLPLLGSNEQWMRWAFGGGAVMVLAARIAQAAYSQSDNIRLNRLYRILVVSALLYVASAAVTFFDRGTSNWIAFLLAGAVLQIYASAMIDKIERNLNKS